MVARACAIAFGLVAVCAACRTMPSPTPPPAATPDMTRVAQAVARLTAAVPRAITNPTPLPTPTVQPMPTDRPEPLVVGVSRAEAEREVLSWLDPSRAPRIEWSRYVRRSDLARQGITFLRDLWDDFHDVPVHSLPDPLIVVLASTRGIDPMVGPTKEHGSRQPGNSQPAALWPDRMTLVAVFDANTGERVAAIPVQGWAVYDGRAYDDTAAYRDLRPADLRFDPAARPTATPRPTVATETATAGPSPTPWPPTAAPTAVPASAHLTWANIPAELAPTFRAYALAPGSSWTWRYTHQNGDVLWTVQVISETIEAAWLEGDHAVVRSRFGSRRLTPARTIDGVTEPGTSSWTALRYVTADVIAANRDDTWWAGAARHEPNEEPEPFDATGIALVSHVDFLPGSNPGETYDGLPEAAASPPGTIATRAGRFDGCWRLIVIGGASWGSERWLCPGVGIVQYGFGDAAGYHASAAVAELIRWRTATLPER